MSELKVPRYSATSYIFLFSFIHKVFIFKISLLRFQLKMDWRTIWNVVLEGVQSRSYEHWLGVECVCVKCKVLSDHIKNIKCLKQLCLLAILRENVINCSKADDDKCFQTTCSQSFSSARLWCEKTSRYLVGSRLSLSGVQQSHEHTPFSVYSPYSLSVSLIHSHTSVVSIMAAWCLYNDLIFPDRKAAIGFVCHTKRREAAWVQVDHPALHAHPPKPLSSHRLPMSTEALINRGRALALCGSWTKAELQFCWRWQWNYVSDWHNMNAL